jgi:hypothetical protein
LEPKKKRNIIAATQVIHVISWVTFLALVGSSLRRALSQFVWIAFIYLNWIPLTFGEIKKKMDALACVFKWRR